MSRKRQAINMVTHVLQRSPPPLARKCATTALRMVPLLDNLRVHTLVEPLSRTRRNAHARGLFEAARRENAFANCEHDHMIAVTRADTDTLVSSYLRPASFQMIITSVRSRSRDR